MPFTAFISDLHLTRSRPAITRIFEDFLRRVAPEADALYILGDLFEYWAGDDDLSDPLNGQVAGALSELARTGTPIYLMHGNRDFLMLDRFARAARSELISDPTTVDLYGQPTLLMHGDTLCTDDTRYQAFRARVRRPLWQRVFLLQPLWLRRAEIERARRLSERARQEKPAAIMDVTASAVQQAFKDCACSRMIHGHTHRPARHVHQLDGRICERWVLSDWYKQGQYLRVTPERCESIALT